MNSKIIKDEKLSNLFDYAIAELKKLEDVSNEDKLFFYSRYKQATVGNNPQKSAPSFFDFVGKAKWEKWNTCMDMTPDKAANEYIVRVSELVGRDLFMQS